MYKSVIILIKPYQMFTLAVQTIHCIKSYSLHKIQRVYCDIFPRVEPPYKSSGGEKDYEKEVKRSLFMHLFKINFR